MPITLRTPVAANLLDRARQPVLSLLDALAAPHGADRYLDLAKPNWSRHEIRATVRRIHHQTPDTVTIELRPNANWKGFRPGQYVDLSVIVDGVRHTRCYSPANAPGDRTIELTARLHPDGKVSPHLHADLRRGDVVLVSPAGGSFGLPEALPEHLLLVCAGTGITPLLSMLRWLDAQRHRGRITFVQYAADASQALYRHELAALALRNPNLRLVHIATDDTATAVPGDEPAGHEPALHGFCSDAHLATLVGDLREVHALACGPTALLDALRGAFARAGASGHLSIEEFTPPPIPTDVAAQATGRVTFARSGVSATTNGETLLELAESAGLTPAHGCRMGICHTCTTPLVSGAVRDIRTGRVCTQPGAGVQLCVSIPLADTALDV